MTPKREYRIKDLTGKKFGAWTVLSFCECTSRGTVWLCECECERKTIRRVRSRNLQDGISKSCGCLSIRKGKGWIKGYVGYIPLTKGMVAAVSVYRVADLQRWNWYVVNKKGLWYAYRNGDRSKGEGKVSMARYILGMEHSDKRVADHRNRRTLDNRDRNLRPATHNQSQTNKGVRWDSVTGIKGIRRCKAKGEFVGRFQVRLTHIGVCLHLGTYDTLEEAQKVRNEVALKLHGKFAVIKGE